MVPSPTEIELFMFVAGAVLGIVLLILVQIFISTYH